MRNHVTLIMGGQYGSEGKGNVVAWLAKKKHYDLVIRTGSPNSGHTFIGRDDKPCIMRQLPCSWAFQDTPIYIPAGAVIDVNILKDEIDMVRASGYKGKIMISPNATVIEPSDIEVESAILSGTTQTGSGSARASKCIRKARIAKDVSELRRYIKRPDWDVSEILIESTQGFGLSLDGLNYPYVTSTNLTPYRILDDAEIPYNRYNVSVWMLFRTFPIRIAGNSGPLPLETSWQLLQSLYGSHIPTEFTSVTKKQRRVGFFDVIQARAAIQRCNPDVLALTFFDYLFPLEVDGKLHATLEMASWLSALEDSLERHITFLGISRKDLVPNIISDQLYKKEYHDERIRLGG